MKLSSFVLLGMLSLSAFSGRQGDNVEFSCFKKNKASNTCHFNFIVDGARYRFVDIGCRFEKKRDDVVEKAKQGELALAKDWKIDCPAVKDPQGKTSTQGGF